MCLRMAACSALIACGSESRDSTQPDSVVVSNLPTCGSTTALFTTSPVSFSDLLGWVPLGSLNPPGHLMPTDHQYLYINSPDFGATPHPVNVVSPGNITILRAHRTHYSTTNTYDYDIEFSPCAEVFAQFSHLTTLAQALLDRLGAFDQHCSSYTLGTPVTFTNCFTKDIEVAVGAGDAIGTAGGQGTSFALDFGLRDARAAPHVFANPSRWRSNPDGNDQFHIAAPSDYFAEPVRTQIRARLGRHNGSAIRTIEPVGGTIAYDVAGTARGAWFNASQPTTPEGPHLAIALDNVDPTLVTFSVGTSQPAFQFGAYTLTPLTSGLVNRDPQQITADGNIYCFEFGLRNAVILIRMESATTLRVEGRTGPTTCAAQQPWAFTNLAFTYVR